jgi:hypothetical protein
MPDEVILDVTTIEENVTVETTAGDVVEIQVVAPAGPAGATGAAGPNSVTSATTSDYTAELNLLQVNTGVLVVTDGVTIETLDYNFGTGSAQALKDAIEIASADISDFTSAVEAIAPDEVTSATTSDGTASLDISNLTLSQAITSGIQTKMTFAAQPTTVGDGQQIVWQWYNGGSPLTTAVIATEATSSNSDKLLFKTSESGSLATSLDLNNSLATFSGVVSSLGATYQTGSTFTYNGATAAAHRTALGLSTLATTTPAANVATFLATPTSANLAAAVTGETGTGALVFAESPSLTSPTIGTSATFNATTYTYGAGAAAAHRDALGVAGKQSKSTTTAVTSTSGVAADISDLTGFVLEANTTYRLTLHSIITTSTGGSFEFFFIASGTTYQGGVSQAGAGVQRSGAVLNGGYHYSTTSFTPLYATQNLSNGHTYGEYYFRTSGTAGTAKMQFAQRSSAVSGTTTIAAGTTAILEKIS